MCAFSLDGLGQATLAPPGLPKAAAVANLAWLRLLNLDGGYHAVARNIWEQLDLLSFVRLGKTCSLLAGQGRHLLKRRYKLESFLSNFLEHPTAFRRLMKDTDAMISSPCVANWIYGTGEYINVLEIFVDGIAHFHLLAEHIKSHEPHLKEFDVGNPDIFFWTSDKFYCLLGRRWRSVVLRLPRCTTNALTQAMGAMRDTSSTNFITWDAVTCLFPGPSLAIPSQLPHEFLAVMEISRKHPAAVGITFELRPQGTWVPSKDTFDDPVSRRLHPAAASSDHALAIWPELRMQRSFGDSYSWVIPFDRDLDDGEILTPRQPVERVREVCFFSLGKRYGLQIPSSMGGTPRLSTIPESPALSLFMFSGSSPLLRYRYSWTNVHSPASSLAFFGMFVSCRLSHFYLHWAARTRRDDLPMGRPGCLPEPLTPAYVREVLSKVNTLLPALSSFRDRELMPVIATWNCIPEYWPRYDGELKKWYEEYRMGIHPHTMFEPSTEDVHQYDTETARASEEVQPDGEWSKDFCCRKSYEDYNQLLQVLRTKRTPNPQLSEKSRKRHR